MLRRAANLIFWSIFILLLTLIVGGAWFVIHGYGEAVQVVLHTEELSEPRQAIILGFSRSMRPNSFRDSISLEPDIAFTLEWHNREKELIIIPERDWPLGTDIRLSVGSGRSHLFGRSSPLVSTLASPSLPIVTQFWPEKGATDVILGVEDPIRVILDRSSRNFFLDFRLSPSIPVIYRNNPEKTEFEILPQTPLEAGKQYRLEVWAKWKYADDEMYQPLSDTLFTLAPPAPTTWNRDLSLRTEEAKRFTRAKKSEGKYIDINLSAQIMTLFENGRVLESFVISSGMRGMDTPKGEFAIENKADRPWSKRYSLFMPYWQAITPDGLFGIHELPEWPGGYKEGANHLGTPVSHGCVRLGVGPAKRVYEWTEIGTPVVVY